MRYQELSLQGHEFGIKSLSTNKQTASGRGITVVTGKQHKLLQRDAQSSQLGQKHFSGSSYVRLEQVELLTRV